MGRVDDRPPRQRLILAVPAGIAPPTLAGVLAAGDVAAVVLEPAGGATGTLVEAAQQQGVAALVTLETSPGGAPPWPLGYGADGLHVAGDEGLAERIVRTRPEGATVGAAAASRHGAMSLGEAGADYVWFGATASIDVEMLEHACWWQALFEVPAVAAGPADHEAVRRLIETGVEFIAVNVFDADDPAALVAAINRQLHLAGEVR